MSFLPTSSYLKRENFKARAHTERKRNEDKQNPTREKKRDRMATSATSSLLSVGSMRSALLSSSTTSRDAIASSSSTSSSGFARASKKMLSSAQRRMGTNVRGSVDTNTNKENCRKRVVASSMSSSSSSSSSSETKSEAEKFSENIVLEEEEEEEELISTTRKTSNTIDEEKVADLTKKKEELKQKQMEMQRAIDTAYESLFEGVSMADAEEEMGKEENELTADVSDAFVEDFPITTEKKFKNVCEINPKVGETLLKIASEDGKKYLQFQKVIHASKGTLARVSNELEANELALSTAARGGRGFLSRPEEHEQDTIEEGISIDDEALYLSSKKTKIVLISGFESFNVRLYKKVSRNLKKRYPSITLYVFSDRDITGKRRNELERALDDADVFFGSLLFDYDQVEWLREKMEKIKTKFVFESALELMSETNVGTFEMKPGKDGAKAGPPPAVQKILKKFGSGKEEDKLVGYLSFLKIGPQLLRFIPGEKAKDLKNWLTVYAYWNQGGEKNVEEAFSHIAREYLGAHDVQEDEKEKEEEKIAASPGDFVKDLLLKPLRKSVPLLEGGLKPLVETPAFGCYHPLLKEQNLPYPETIDEYKRWAALNNLPTAQADPTKPVVAVLLYRKHVITEQPYLAELIRGLEQSGVVPIPCFINGVEAHTIVRDKLTSSHEQFNRNNLGIVDVDSLKPDACKVDAIVSTVGFPLVGGPAGSMEAGRQSEIANKILKAKNVPYFVAAPLLIQDIASWWESGVGGLQSTILYALPELDGAIDAVSLGGLCGDDIFLVKERVFALSNRIKKWHALKQKENKDKKIAMTLYGFPPGVGATGTAALLNVPKSIDETLATLRKEGYDLGVKEGEPLPTGEAIVLALRNLEEVSAIMLGAQKGGEQALSKTRRDIAKIKREEEKESESDESSPKGNVLSLPDNTLQPAGMDVSPSTLRKWLSFPADWGPNEWGPCPQLPPNDILIRRMEKAWGNLEQYRGLNTNASGFNVAGFQLGNVFIGVQPALGVEGDPMRLLFERDLTPHPQYAAYYKYLQYKFQADAVLHFGMHGTVEWLPGSPLGNTGLSWSEQLLGAMPNVYVYAANNPSESIVAKRRGYGVIVSHNVPPYGRAGLYKQTAELRELLNEYRESQQLQKFGDRKLRGIVANQAAMAQLDNDVPCYSMETNELLSVNANDAENVWSDETFENWANALNEYLFVLENRLFSEGLHVLGRQPDVEQSERYLDAYFGEEMTKLEKRIVASTTFEHAAEISRAQTEDDKEEVDTPELAAIKKQLDKQFDIPAGYSEKLSEAITIKSLLQRNDEELDVGLVSALNGDWVQPAAGGDLLRDGPGVLPTGRNIHALDPYRMPSNAAFIRGNDVANEIIARHRHENDGQYPETVSVNLWGLDAIKTKGESVAIVLALLGARSVKEKTGRVARYELIPLEELGRPRIDVLCNMSGIFRDAFANVVGLLDDCFSRCAEAEDEPIEMNFVRKHALEMQAKGLDATSSRLFSNPPGDYGSMVNERVGNSSWNDTQELGDTWASRNAYSYGKSSDEKGVARPEVLNELLRSTERVVQEIDSVEYGLTDIQEYYANTGAIVAAANAAKEDAADATEKDSNGAKSKPAFKKVQCSVVETFGKDAKGSVKDLDETLRLEYRTKLLNPRWAKAMAESGSGGAFEISQRMTALIGWGATTGFTEDWVYDGANETYVEDEEMRKLLQKNNPEAFRNVVKRMLEAHGRGMWNADADTIENLKKMYSDAEDRIEGVL